jgi:hypothetical protein
MFFVDTVMKYLSKAYAYIFLLIFSIQNTAFAVEVLVDSGQRQTVLERTKQYAGKVDAVDIRANAAINFQKNLKVHSGGSTSGEKAKCGGYTTSSCGIPCCGEKECSSVCTANLSIAHGNTCLSEYTTSPCGMSCCGKEDCDRVCYNYRATTVSPDKCGGYIKTATGEPCCGLADCRNRNCGGYTSTTSADFGIEQSCCGKKNCDDVRCDYTFSTDVISGGTAKCCGTKDCYSKYCEELTSVDSKVYPDKKNLACCGKENCHQVECDGYTQTNTPSGVRQCCGYEDCRDKECQYRRVAKDPKGQLVACCGIEDCGNIEAKAKNKVEDGNASRSIQTYRQTCGSQSGFSMGCSGSFAVVNGVDLYTPSLAAARYLLPRYNNYHNGGRTWDPGRVITFTFKELNQKYYTHHVGQVVPSGCKVYDTETYDGETYYHYECVSTKVNGNPNDYFCYFNLNADCMGHGNWGDGRTRHWGGGTCNHRVGQQVTCSCKYPVQVCDRGGSLVRQEAESGRYNQSYWTVCKNGRTTYEPSVVFQDRCNGRPETTKATITGYYPTYGY